MSLHAPSTRAARARRGGARLALLLALLIAAGAGAWFLAMHSGGDGADGDDLPCIRLELSREDGYLAAEATRERVFAATRELEGVHVEAKNHVVQPRDVGTTKELMLLMRGRGPKRVDLPGQYDPRSFNRVVVRFLTFANEAVHIELLRAGKSVLRTPAQVVGGSRDPQSLVFDVPETGRMQRPLDELRIHVEGRSKPSAVFTVDLVRRPLEAWLPEPGAEAPVEIDLESRMAVGLSSRHPLVAETILPPGARLSFGFGRPAALTRADASPRVRVTVRQGERSESHDFPLAENAWTSQQLSLRAFEDRRATLRFELLVEGDAEQLCALASPVVWAPGGHPPTVLLITSDTHRADHLGSAGSRFELATPALDALAARGVLFERAYSSTNVTNPSHIALMTATSPRDTEIINNHVQLSDAAPTLAERFREAGYVTFASLCAKHLGHTTSGLGQGFDRMIRPKGPFTDAEVAIDLLRQCLPDAEGRPLFVWLHVFDAHHPYGPPGEYDRRYWDAERDPFDPSLPAVELPGGVPTERVFPPDLVELRDLEFPRAQYKAEITYLDDQLGRVFGWPRFRDALIAMTADHGESFGEHGVYYDHAGAYPQNIHVPLILAGPGVPSGVRSPHPVRQIDVGRTLLDRSGLGGTEFPGRDLIAASEDPAIEPHFTLSAHGFDASVTLGDLHLVLHLRDGQGTELRKYWHCHTELYDLERDPECTVDLWEVPEYAERGAELRSTLVRWLADARPTGWAVAGTLTAETQAELNKLGYAANAAEPERRVWFEDCED